MNACSPPRCALLRLHSRQLGRSSKATPPERCRGLSRPRVRQRRTRRMWRIAISPAPQRREGWPKSNSADRGSQRPESGSASVRSADGQRPLKGKRPAQGARRGGQYSAAERTRACEDQAMRDRLDKMKGDAFDHDYIRGQISAHQETLQLFEYEIGSGQDSQLKNFATQTLPVLMEHLEMAQNINARLTGAAVR
jgi:Domain of unknown function (DUF4142)